MSIIASYRRPVKSDRLHPFAPLAPKSTTFGEGIEVESTPVNRVAPYFVAEKPAPVAQWTELEWRRAEYFGLRAPAGMKRPTVVPAPAPVAPTPVEVEVETPAPVEVESSAKRQTGPILLVRGERQVWNADQQVWTFEPAIAAPVETPTPLKSDLSAPAPVKPILLKRGPSRPSREDSLWHAAFALAVEGIEANPPKGLDDDDRAVWSDGYHLGDVQRDADLEATANMYDAMANSHWMLAPMMARD